MEIYKGILCISGTELTAPSENSGGGGEFSQCQQFKDFSTPRSSQSVAPSIEGLLRTV